MVNYLALLGWGPKDGVEIRPLDEIVELFRLEDVTPSPAFFDEKKLTHVNAEHVRALPVEQFLDRARPVPRRRRVGPAAGADRWPGAGAGAGAGRGGADDRLPARRAARGRRGVLVEGHGTGQARARDARCDGRALDELDTWSAATVRLAVEAAAVAVGLVNAEGEPQLSKAQAPVRVATTGRSVGPPLFESLEALGRERTLERLRAARSRL